MLTFRDLRGRPTSTRSRSARGRSNKILTFFDLHEACPKNTPSPHPPKSPQSALGHKIAKLDQRSLCQAYATRRILWPIHFEENGSPPIPFAFDCSHLVLSGLVLPGLVSSGLVCLVWPLWPGLARSGLVWSNLVCPALAWSGPVWSCLVWPGLAWSVLAWSGLV